MKKSRNLTKFNGLMIKAIGAESMIVIYKLYETYLGNNMTLGGVIPTWFVFLILLVPVSPLIGKLLKKDNDKISESNGDLAELISNLKGED
ncbi:hypothetical protein [Clostridium paraputrificum]|uniref:hypothetical protein n=1 Tax=Clostridium paraputrificum TaxID=29363 RepID=UPI00189D3A95|nr:hypothetical protein [Clostridium paraputrificum]